jgi:hypothetical protein
MRPYVLFCLAGSVVSSGTVTEAVNNADEGLTLAMLYEERVAILFLAWFWARRRSDVEWGILIDGWRLLVPADGLDFDASLRLIARIDKDLVHQSMDRPKSASQPARC